MATGVSKKPAARALIFLVASVLSGCCHELPNASVPPCPKPSREAILQLMALDEDPEKRNEDLVHWAADEIIPYCNGVDAVD